MKLTSFSVVPFGLLEVCISPRCVHTVHPSVHLSVHLSIHLSVHPSLHSRPQLMVEHLGRVGARIQFSDQSIALLGHGWNRPLESFIVNAFLVLSVRWWKFISRRSVSARLVCFYRYKHIMFILFNIVFYVVSLCFTHECDQCELLIWIIIMTTVRTLPCPALT